MKKCLVVVSVMCLALLAGCGKNKVLVCSTEKTSLGVTVKQDVEVSFVSNKIEKIAQVYNIKVSDTYKSAMSRLISTYQTQYEKLYVGSTVKVKQVGDTEIKVTVDTDYMSMTDAEKKKSGFYGSEDYDVNKSTLEKKGYTCK